EQSRRIRNKRKLSEDMRDDIKGEEKEKETDKEGKKDEENPDSKRPRRSSTFRGTLDTSQQVPSSTPSPISPIVEKVLTPPAQRTTMTALSHPSTPVSYNNIPLSPYLSSTVSNHSTSTVSTTPTIQNSIHSTAQNKAPTIATLSVP